jgi:Fur family peroxide stress response transcriptional regulator
LGDGVDHFDADTSEHYHVICSGCGSVTDLEMMGAKIPIDTSILPYDGTITGHIIYFTGICKKCNLKDEQ